VRDFLTPLAERTTVLEIAKDAILGRLEELKLVEYSNSKDEDEDVFGDMF